MSLYARLVTQTLLSSEYLPHLREMQQRRQKQQEQHAEEEMQKLEKDRKAEAASSHPSPATIPDDNTKKDVLETQSTVENHTLIHTENPPRTDDDDDEDAVESGVDEDDAPGFFFSVFPFSRTTI